MRLVLLATVTPVLTCSALAAARADDVIRTAAELSAATYDRADISRRFDLEGRIVALCPPGEECCFSLEDESGCIMLRAKKVNWAILSPSLGWRIRTTGFINIGIRSRQAYALCDRLDMLSPGAPPAPTPVTFREFLSGAFDDKPVTVTGVVRDIVTDEIDAKYTYLVLSADGETISFPIPADDPALRTLAIGSTIEATGLCAPSDLGARRQLGRHLQPVGRRIRILTNAKDDPFDVPEVDWSTRPRPQDIAALGRRRISGRILAAWRGNALLRTDGGRVVRLENTTSDMPHCGDAVEAVGFPESDLYNINLSRVIWRKTARAPLPDEQPLDASDESLLTDMNGRREFNPFVHGRTIRILGKVLNMPDPRDAVKRFNLQCGKLVMPVDASDTPSTLDRISVGSEIAASGICVMDSDSWRPNTPFPTMRGFFLVVRRLDDIVVLKAPSCWTSPRLAAALGSLFVLLVGSLVWNALLKRLTERRGRELAQTAIAKAESDLKVYERTRLAVELHDSLSQYLTGISLAIRAALRLAVGGSADLRRNLTLAATSLDSCRQELRNCLWDLRNETLDEADLNTAIRQTLEPHLGESELAVRFNVPRERFTDNTLHAVLCIVRELVINAVRHGDASKVRIAGAIEGRELLFSVEDDGCGFDVANRPGMREGHFGLQGIQERINGYKGQMKISSVRGKGTKVTLSMKLPQGEER